MPNATMPDATVPDTRAPDIRAADVRSDDRAGRAGRSPDEEDTDTLYVAGIGASAGGLEALQAFFRAMPADTGMAFVIVQHLSPDHESLMDELLAKYTDMPVRQAGDGTVVEANHVYLIPPRKNMTIFHGQLFLDEQDRSRGQVNYPIDRFLDSLAKNSGNRAIAVILSGTGSDGTQGIRAIKSRGGYVVVQDAGSAQYDGMPRSALRTGLVDHELQPEAMHEALRGYVRYPQTMPDVPQQPEQVADAGDTDKGDTDEGDTDEGDTNLAKILSVVHDATDVDFSLYKRTTIWRRIQHRMTVRQASTLQEYVDLLTSEEGEADLLCREMLIRVTRFFRDPDVFDTVAEKVVPAVVEAAEKRGSATLRAWVPGCSTGEEAYTVAILLREYLDARRSSLHLKVFATDIDAEALDHAAAGLYPGSIATHVSPDRLQRYFQRIGDQYQVSRELRKSVVIAPHNLLSDPPFSRLDFVSCRNLLIYLLPDAQRRVLQNLAYGLVRDGYLLLGTSESNDVPSFATVHARHRVYRSRGRGRPARTVSRDPAQEPGTAAQSQPSSRLPKSADLWRRRPVSMLEDYFKRVVSEFMPPAVVVDDDNRVLHVFGDASEFLSVPSGRADMDLLRMLAGPMRVVAGTALHKARAEGARITFRNVAMDEDDDGPRVDLLVDVHQNEDEEVFAIIVFRTSDVYGPSPEPNTGDAYEVDAATEERIEALRRRLHYTEENLQATVEELETSNEELQATNEELMASNEELQSTNEELHSVNEELVTVNAELQEKIRKLTEANDDIDNLLRSTGVRALFLDANLCVRRSTPLIGELVNVLDSDEGRPVSHFTHAFPGVDLEEEAQAVFSSQTPCEHQVQSRRGEWYSLHLRPYRRAEGDVDGVVVTFETIPALDDAKQQGFGESEGQIR